MIKRTLPLESKMNLIATLCPLEDILLGRDIANKNRLFDEIAHHVQQRYGLSERDTFENLSAREALGSTAVGYGVAIPHARMAGLDQLVAVFIRPVSPIPFDAPDRKPVSAVFALLVPEQAQQEHLYALADCARLFSERSFREQLGACTNAAEVSRIFSDWSPGSQT